MGTANDEELWVLSNLCTKGLYTLIGLVGGTNELNILEVLSKTLKSGRDLSGSENGLEVAV
jgi:hypothetical protein